MILSRQDAGYFFSLWLPLLKFANEKFQIIDDPDLKELDDYKELDSNDGKQIVDNIWTNDEIIDEYIQAYPNLPLEDQKIVLGWKKHITGSFIVERQLKKGAAFIHIVSDEPIVYYVLGINAPFEDLAFPLPLPLSVQTTLLPFKNVIITDTYFFVNPVTFGRHIKARFKEDYREAKAAGKVYSQIV